MDNRGSSIIEISIILIVIVLIFGVSLSASQIMTQKMSKMAESENIEVKLSEVIDNLINSPGEYNWVKYNKNPGLAIVNEGGGVIPNSVSYSSFIALGSDYDKFVTEKIFDGKLKSSMELIPQESTISSVKIGEEGDGDNVYTVHRLVKCDFYNRYVIKDFQNVGKCNHNHDNTTHSCNYFKIFKGNLKKSDYYILIGDDEISRLNYFVDTTKDKGLGGWNPVDRNRIYLNDKINFENDTSEVVFIHFDRKDAKAVLVSVPKGFDKEKLNYDNFRVNDCELILKAWY